MIKKFLPIIPARGGSKGIPLKNIVQLNGKPLICHTIEAVLNSVLETVPIVSTDCNKIADTARAAGADIIMRPLELAQDNSSSASLVMHLLNTITNRVKNEGFTDIVFLQPTSPLRTSQHINEAVKIYEKSNKNCLVSLVEAEHHPYKNFRLNEEEQLEPLFDWKYLASPRQALPTIFRQNGAIYIFNINIFKVKKEFCLDPFIPYVMDQRSSVDIDTKDDLNYASYLFNKNDS